MLKNYLKIAWRNLLRHKAYSAINIIGLATGISACLLIFLYVGHELTYERNFPNAGHIYRVVSRVNFHGTDDRFSLSPKPLADHLRREVPEVKKVARLAQAGKQTVWKNQQPFLEDHLFYADSTFFQVVPFTFLAGDPATALKAPKTIVISEELAQKYFGGVEQALGKPLQFSKNQYTVTGVFKPEKHSHLVANAFFSMVTHDEAERAGKDATTIAAMENEWIHFSYYTYFTLHNPASLPAFEQKLTDLVQRRAVPWMKENQISAFMELSVQPITQIHLSNDFQTDISPSGSRSYVYIFSVVAVFILLIACINYMNLATARSAKRAREVGLRKVVGAHRSQIIGQFLGESILITLLGLVLALAMVELSLPVFNQLTIKEFTLSSFLNINFALLVLVILLFVGLVAGSYPAFVLSGFKPAEVLKSDKNPRSSNAWLRRSLVVVQFTISLVLIIGTAVVYSQLQFLKDKNLGFNKEQVVAIEVPKVDSATLHRLPVVMQELTQNPNLLQVATSGNIPGEKLSRLLMLVEDEFGTETDKTMNVMFVSYNALELMGIELKEGRTFQKEIPSDAKGAVLVNEAGAKWLGWQNPLGKRVQVTDYDAKVIGVAKNFNYASLHNPIEPLMIVPIKEGNGYLLAKIRPEHLGNTLAFLEQKWNAFAPKHPMDYFFLDDYFNRQYQAEEKMLTIFGYFAALTILIACLGLFGLASFTAEQRTKEIAIRKVLGSTVGEIVLLLSKDFALLVLLAILIASPVAWYGMKNWLQDFAYQVNLSPWLFLMAGVGSLAIAVATVSLQAAKAALLNPVKSLRSE
ncbi:ABC transporter permease [Rufibacter sp. XAAS-G3-1]|uniref:ABC transporter permease n=1 Tax=Rufibacter sp. XAAS-G3-1 TaxID=2729134 RepID=UPI0015E7D335|nr:ABC transporter permease [Rufibacter sp. XAAS-G3-1]